MDRIRQKAISLRANAVIGLDIETSDLGLQAKVTIISATGISVIVEQDKTK